MHDLRHEVLRTDVSGMPLEWIDYQEATRLVCLGQVSYALGTLLYRVHGGINSRTGCRSVIAINAIVAAYGNNPELARYGPHYAPPLTNHALFKRDRNLCLYCGDQFPSRLLSRDHVRPRHRGGSDAWQNVVTACKRCNNHKAGRTPEEAGMQLLAIPFTPTHAEYIYLQGKRILADQMEFLLAHFPRNSPMRQRLAGTAIAEWAQ